MRGACRRLEMRAIVVLVLGLLWNYSPVVCSAQAGDLVLDTDEYHYTASFDPTRISESRLHELLIFSPHGLDGPWRMGGEELQTSFAETPQTVKKSVVPLPLELCIAGNPDYRACGARDISDPNFFENAEVNLRRNEQSLQALNQVDVPPELRGIAAEFADSLRFFTAVERNRLEYLRTGDVEILSAKIGEIDPLRDCAGQIAGLRHANTLQERYKQSRFSWYNCVNAAWERSSPVYPQEAWSSFLRDYDIREAFRYKSID
jgi:hypothetical protein